MNVNTTKPVANTPTPWFIPTRQPCLIAAYPDNPLFEQRSIATVNNSGKSSNFPNATRFALPEDLANAQFIVRAVNSHAALFAACRFAQTALADAVETFGAANQGFSTRGGVVMHTIKTGLAQVQAALALAKEQS